MRQNGSISMYHKWYVHSNQRFRRTLILACLTAHRLRTQTDIVESPRNSNGRVKLRRATAADAPEVAGVYVASRRGAARWLPTVGTDDEIRAFVIDRMIPDRECWVAEADDRIVAVMVLHEDEVDQLYVAPDAQRRGVGDAMLAHAKHLRPAGLRLWAFQRNAPARRFYEARGFVATRFTDGATNMEREADVLYEWKGKP
jgi:GNAT superfamily N-acetyltransferase